MTSWICGRGVGLALMGDRLLADSVRRNKYVVEFTEAIDVRRLAVGVSRSKLGVILGIGKGTRDMRHRQTVYPTTMECCQKRTRDVRSDNIQRPVIPQEPARKASSTSEHKVREPIMICSKLI